MRGKGTMKRASGRRRILLHLVTTRWRGGEGEGNGMTEGRQEAYQGLTAGRHALTNILVFKL